MPAAIHLDEIQLTNGITVAVGDLLLVAEELPQGLTPERSYPGEFREVKEIRFDDEEANGSGRAMVVTEEDFFFVSGLSDWAENGDVVIGKKADISRDERRTDPPEEIEGDSLAAVLSREAGEYDPDQFEE